MLSGTSARPGRGDRRRPAFTLIELLLVVVLIGIIASIAFTRWQDMRRRATVAVLESDLHTLVTAMEQDYHLESNPVGYRWPLTPGNISPSPKVELEVPTAWIAPAAGYVGRARHADLPDTQGRCISIGTPSGVAAPLDSGITVSTGLIYRCLY